MCFSLFAWVFARIFLLFARVFLWTFIIVTHFSLTIFIFVISAPIFPFPSMCACIFVGNFYAIKRHIFWFQVKFSNVTKIPYVMVNEHENFCTTCSFDRSVPKRFKSLVQCCALAFVRQLVGVFPHSLILRRLLHKFRGSYFFFSSL